MASNPSLALQQSLRSFCVDQGVEKTYWVAFSGGMDSHVLLHALSVIRDEFSLKIQAIHVHHGLSPNADSWVLHCQKICDEMGISFCHEKVDAKHATGESPEEIAREKRYEIFAKLLALGDVLLTAQHQDDQAETILLQLIRGAGPKGLASMHKMKMLGKGFLARPFLGFTRKEFAAYAQNYSLQWIEDESNANVNFSRNYMRHEIMPVLKSRWPSVASTLSRSAANCAETQLLIEEISREDLLRVQGSQLTRLSIPALLLLSPARQRAVLRFWFLSLNFSIPSNEKIHLIQNEILAAREDKLPLLKLDVLELRRFQQELILMPSLKEHDPQQAWQWDLKSDLYIPTIGTLQAIPTMGQGLKATISHATIRFRQGGETCQLPGRNHHHTLKNLFNQWKIPTWQRSRLPLVFIDDVLVAIPGYYVSESHAASPGAPGYWLKMEFGT